MTYVRSIISLSNFCLADLFTDESGILKSPTICVWSLMCDLSISNVPFKNKGALVFGAKLFRIETSS